MYGQRTRIRDLKTIEGAIEMVDVHENQLFEEILEKGKDRFAEQSARGGSPAYPMELEKEIFRQEFFTKVNEGDSSIGSDTSEISAKSDDESDYDGGSENPDRTGDEFSLIVN